EADDVEVADGDALVAVAAGAALALLRPAAAAVAGVRAGAAGLAVDLLGAVGGGGAGGVVALHHAGGAGALGRAADVHRLDVGEHVGDGQLVADLDGGRRLQAELTDVALRLAVGLRRQRHAGLGARPAALRLQVRGHVAAFRPRRLAA